MKTIYQRYIILLSILAVVVIGGTMSIKFIEGLSFFDSFYFTIITIATVGYGDISPVHTAGKVVSLVLVIVGVGTFTGVILNTTQLLFERSTESMRRERLNVLIDLYFSEMGTELLRIFSRMDPDIEDVRKHTNIEKEWSDRDFISLRRKLNNHSYKIDLKHVDIDMLKVFLKENSEILLRLLENPNIIEHGDFMELLRATFHLREELLLRHDVSKITRSDLDHLSQDVVRVYIILAKEWYLYVHKLKTRHPYLYSLALRTNPFNEKANILIESK